MLPKKKESHEGDSPDHQGASTRHIMSCRGEGCHPLFDILNKTLQFYLMVSILVALAAEITFIQISSRVFLSIQTDSESHSQCNYKGRN